MFLACVLSYFFSRITTLATVWFHVRVNRGTLGLYSAWVLNAVVTYIVTLPFVDLSFQPSIWILSTEITASDMSRLGNTYIDGSPSWNTFTPPVVKDNYPRTSTQQTILRWSMLSLRRRERMCTQSPRQAMTSSPSVLYDYMASEWQARMLPDGLTPIESHSFSSHSNVDPSDFSGDAAFIKSLFVRGAYLYIDAVKTHDEIYNSGKNTAKLNQLKADTIVYHAMGNADGSKPTTVSEFINRYFTTRSKWSTILRANVSAIAVHYTKFQISDTISFTAVTFDIPLENSIWHRQLVDLNGVLIDANTQWPGTGDIEYQFAVSSECGSRSCALQNRGLSPEPHVLALGVCGSPLKMSDKGFETMFKPLDSSCDDVSDTSAWLFGFGRRIEADAFNEEALGNVASPTLRKGFLTNPRESHRVTMGYLSTEMVNLGELFSVPCSVGADCLGLSYPIGTGSSSSSQEYLVVGRQHVPTVDVIRGFDLTKNFAPGRLSRYNAVDHQRAATGARMKHEMLRLENVDNESEEWSVRPDRSAKQCSVAMEEFLDKTHLNYMWMEHPLQNASSFTILPSKDGSSPQFDRTKKSTSITIGISSINAAIGYVCVAAMLLLGVLCLCCFRSTIKNYSSKKLCQPGVLVRALADGANFPPTMYAIHHSGYYAGPTIAADGSKLNEKNMRDLITTGILFKSKKGRATKVGELT